MRILVSIAVLVFAVWVAACSGATTPSAAAQGPVAQATVPAATSPDPSSSPAAPAPASAGVTVEAYDDFFRPEAITVTVGTQVTWVNLGQKDHTVTYGDLFDGDLKVGDTFAFTFDKPGTYHYYCVTHSESDTEGMVGTVTVVAP